MDRLQAMTTFVAVAETGGFASAARKLAVSPSVVSRVVTELETHLGVRLLTRTTRVVRLTDAGSAYFEDCRRILSEIDDAELSAAGTHGSPRGQLVITAPTLFGRMHVMPVVTAYLSRYPDVDAHCWFVDRVVNMVEEGIDVAIRIGPLANSTLQAVRVGEVRRLLVASPEYLARMGVPTRPEDLHAHQAILTSGSSAPSEWRFGGDAHFMTTPIRARLTATTNDATIAAAESGFGIARALSYQVVDAIRAGRLRIVLAEFAEPAVPIHVVHREGRHAARKVRAFLDMAIDALRSNPALNDASTLEQRPPLT
ncbi:LysR family transcriptional regulator [Pararobbsia silviterrae]|uniref:LysR family transcriptional regulator n=1 Tax=Pararobbsia silviterrae TaxID=1792498 RepID=A0A494XQN7_9BURK|nr:LysR family transcriptional regulator [Pararobbsia silviterrae]RKP51951.1 LysR family transcriptional regulator [Pararobbsia silviterrae]